MAKKKSSSTKIYNRDEDINTMSKEHLEIAIRTLAKTANQRLRTLERKSYTKTSLAYKYLETKFYDDVNYMTTTSHGEMKFKTSTKGRTFQELRNELSELRNFLYTSKTSTIKGIKNAYEKSYETFIKNNSETGLSFQEYGELWAQRNIKEYSKMYGSSQIIEFIEAAKELNKSYQDINDILTDIVFSNEETRQISTTEMKERLSELSTNEIDLSLI